MITYSYVTYFLSAELVQLAQTAGYLVTGIQTDGSALMNTVSTEIQSLALANNLSIPGDIGYTFDSVGESTRGFSGPSNLQIPVANSDEVVTPNTMGYYDPYSQQYYITNSEFGGVNVSTVNPTSLGDLSSVDTIMFSSVDLINAIFRVGSSAPSVVGIPVDTGKSNVPGSFAGSPYTDLIPPDLNLMFMSAVLSQSTYSVDQAIQQVIDCNCDCWVNL